MSILDDKNDLDDVVLKSDNNDFKQKNNSNNDYWKIMIVDDEPAIHESTQLALENITFANKPISFISAYSGEDAKKILKDNPNVAVILLDVVMETMTSGLDVAKYVREKLNNKLTRIILRTDQPGPALERSIVVEYDINDYKMKADQTQDKLISTTLLALRGYKDLMSIEHERQKLKRTNEQLNKEIEKQQQLENELTMNKEALELLIEKRTKELIEIKKNMEQNKRSKSELLANLNHEIKTTISRIVGKIDVMIHKENFHSHTDDLSMIKNKAQSLLSFINDLIDLENIESDQLNMTFDDFDFYQSMIAIKKSFSVIASHKQLNLTLSIDQAIPQTLNGAIHRVEQVLRHLISNAIKFTEHGAIAISIKPFNKSTNPLELIFSIKDTGIGIPKDQILTIFTGFNQINRSYAKRHKGAGLSLHITHKIVEQLGGRIWVESQEGHGATFYFTCVFQKTNQLTSKEEVPDKHENFSDKKNPSYTTNVGKVILLAEDDELNQKSISFFLKRLGFKVYCASNGIEALQILKKIKVDLILMDVQMPEMNGIETTQTIRSGKVKTCSPNIPIIALTAFVMLEDKEAFMTAGVDDYLSKPVKMNILNDRINQLLIKSNLSDSIHEIQDRDDMTKKSDSLDSKTTAILKTELEEYINQADYDVNFLKELLSTFVRSTMKYMDLLKQSMSEKNYHTMKINAHSLSNIFSGLFINTLFNVSKEMETEISNEKNLTVCWELYHSLTHLLQLTIDIIHSFEWFTMVEDSEKLVPKNYNRHL